MKRLILASASPRRKALLSRFDLDLEILTSDLEEKVHPGETPEQVAMTLAFQKALDVVQRVQLGDVVLAADTIVFSDEILGKPVSRQEAYNMLKKLSGQQHAVITGLAILKAGTPIKVVDYVQTMVTFRKLSEEKINAYLDTEEFRDKAGAYGIQGLGALLVEEINGSYSNVVGLPLTKVDHLLERHFDMKLM